MDASLIPSDDDEEEPRKDDSMMPSDDDENIGDNAPNVRCVKRKKSAGRASGRLKKQMLPEGWVSAFASPATDEFVRGPDTARPLVQPATAKLLLPNYKQPVGTAIPEGGYRVVDLFASIGGVSCGATLEGHSVVLAVDMDARRLKTHALNFPHAKRLCMALGPETEEELVAAIHEAVPASEWHRLWLHASPPCQSQSTFTEMGRRKRRKGAAPAQLAKERAQAKARGLRTVDWTLRLIERLQPPQFSIEEVSDAKGCVLEHVRALRARRPSLIDCDVIDMADFGVPQTRERMIAARPATIHALRFAPRLRVHPRVTILDVLTLPEGVTFMRSRKSHKVNPTDVQPCPNIRGGYTDGYVTFYPLDAPAPTQMGTAPNWDAADFVTDVGRLSADDCRALATFPTSFRWPPKATKKDAEEGYGNCVPPLFVQKLFRAASTTVA